EFIPHNLILHSIKNDIVSTNLKRAQSNPFNGSGGQKLKRPTSAGLGTMNPESPRARVRDSCNERRDQWISNLPFSLGENCSSRTHTNVRDAKRPSETLITSTECQRIPYFSALV